MLVWCDVHGDKMAIALDLPSLIEEGGMTTHACNHWFAMPRSDVYVVAYPKLPGSGGVACIANWGKCEQAPH